MNEAKANKIVGKIIDLLRSEGVKVDTPYDLENFFEDYCSHSQQRATGKFALSEDDE